MVSMYIEALLHVPPREVTECFIDTLVSLCVAFRENSIAYEWLEASLHHVPITVFTIENKQRLLNTVKDGYDFRQSSLQTELDLLAKRARSSAIRSN